jgi:HSP20 family protein
LDRALDEAYGELAGVLGEGWALRKSGREGRVPALNIWESEGQVHAEAEVPGLRMEDLEILVKGSELTIKGERKASESAGVGYHRRERGTGPFSGTVRLPVEVDVEKVEAQLENGVLTITLPKAASALPRKIAVRGAN